MDKKQKTTPAPLHLVLLHEELNRRIRANSQYSLRSFAKQISIDASLLSKILKNTRPMTPENAKRIVQKSQMSDAEKKLFWDSFIEYRESRIQQSVEQVMAGVDPRESEERLISNDTFQMIAGPEHYILTELTRTKNFISDVPWISKRLGLSTVQTRECIRRLVRVGLLEEKEKRWVRKTGRFTTSDKSITDAALKHHQQKVLEGAQRALDQIAIDIRSQSSMTIAINPKKIPLAKKMIQEFVNQLSNVLEAGPLEEVYQLSVSLFPAEVLTQSGAPKKTGAQS